MAKLLRMAGRCWLADWRHAAGCASLLAATAQVCAAEPLNLYFFERPPYAVQRAGSDEVHGLSATPAAQAFKSAGIAFRWVGMPTMRQLVTLKNNGAPPACAVGWFKNPERELHFKFSKPIYRDKPTVALARADYTQASATLADTLRQPGLQVLIKDGFSYGPLIDQLLIQSKVERIVTSADSVPMIRMVAAQRAHFMFAAEEEAAYLVEQAGVPTTQLRTLRFTDLPHGERRHILCSKTVPDELIERLNKAITVEIP
ncbi:MAG TPA: transporter substrate-binding domain-containing protein [Ideonella sp.]|uniref:substrate-binding periplasmic protein n=1 Tax=Ideonella sp. TaxID=1929293 RepID=UPI002E34C956|nr:transporter substrate-binding domain-containing protein [Ideonella sp.]HEX5683005.1 transporter substrate-binding domain-containing protein [Ideonella sp.]